MCFVVLNSVSTVSQLDMLVNTLDNVPSLFGTQNVLQFDQAFLLFFVAFFLEMAPPPPTNQETHAAMVEWDFYFNPFGDMSKYAAYDFICFGALLLAVGHSNRRC